MPGSPVVASAIAFPAGTRHEPEGKGGLAHLLEHLMFKGSGRWGPGDIDRTVGAFGGDANAFTAHDVVVYTIDLPPGEWRLALEIETARMTGLDLASDEVERERRVVMEEIASAEADPWYRLDQSVMERIYRGHPYRRPILGTVESVARIGRADLRRFHRSSYGPEGAVLVAAGPLGSGDLDGIAAAFEEMPVRSGGRLALDSAAEATTVLSAPDRVESPIGGIRRLLVAWPVPGDGHPDLPALRLASVILTGGRSGPLHRELVEERELCTWVTTDVSDSPGPGTFTLACELHREESPSAVEGVVFAILRRLGSVGPIVEEMERAKRTLRSEWLFDRETAHDVAVAVAEELVLYGREERWRSLLAALECDGERLRSAVAAWLADGVPVIGTSGPPAPGRSRVEGGG